MKRLLFAFVLILLLSCESDKSPFEPPDDNWGPTDLQLTQILPTSVVLSWKDQSDFEQGFIIDRRENNNDYIHAYAIVARNDLTFVDSLLNWESSYYYKVCAYYKEEFSSYTGEGIDLSDSSPSNLNITQLSLNSVELNWQDNSSWEEGFRIDKKINNNDWIVNFVQTTNNITDFTDFEVDPFNTYSYRISAYLENTYSDGIIDSVYIDFLAPSNFQIIQTSISSAELTWNDNSVGEENFIINRKKNNNNWQNEFVILNADIEEWIDEDIEVCSHYYYQIFARKDTLETNLNENDLNINPMLVGSCDTNDASDVEVINNYAYISDYFEGLKVIDISNTSNPVLTSSCFTNDGWGINVEDNYAYVASGTYGMTIINIEDPTLPTIIGNCDTSDAKDVFVQNDIAYIAIGDEGLKIFDISEPDTPILLGEWNESYVQGVIVEDFYAYIACRNNGLKILEVSNPSLPVLTGSCNTYIAVRVFKNNDYVYIANADPWNHGGLDIVDIANPSNPIIIGSLELDGVRDVFAINDLLYLTNDSYSTDTQGLIVVDISQPNFPEIVGHCYTNDPRGLFITDNYAYVACRTAGLKIIKIAE